VRVAVVVEEHRDHDHEEATDRRHGTWMMSLAAVGDLPLRGTSHSEGDSLTGSTAI
jgi:hypothetical protein